MKILHVINGLGSGGAENLITNLLPLFSEYEDFEVELLILTTNNSFYYDKLSKNIKISVSPISNIKSIKQVKFIKDFIKKGNFDIVHAHLFPVLYWVSLAVRKTKKNKPKLIYTEHSTFNRRRKWYYKAIERYIYKPYDSIIAISEGTKVSLSKWLGKKQGKKIVVIENGIQLDKFKNAIPYLKSDLVSSIKETDKMVLMVGRFSEAKDQKTLIKAVSILPADYHVVLVGEGELMQECINYSKQINVLDRTHFLGLREDVDRITKTADVCVISSKWEGFGLVAVEGMASGKVVIGTNVEGLRDVIKNKKYLFEVGDFKKIANIVVSNVNNTKLLDNSGKYDIRETFKSILELYLGEKTNEKN